MTKEKILQVIAGAVNRNPVPSKENIDILQQGYDTLGIFEYSKFVTYATQDLITEAVEKAFQEEERDEGQH